MYEFAYCFSINDRVQWSAETAQSLQQRLKNAVEGLEDDELSRVLEFIETARPGEFTTVNDGTLIFRCSLASIEASRPSPRPLFDVLDEAGLLESEGGIQLDKVL